MNLCFASYYIDAFSLDFFFEEVQQSLNGFLITFDW